MRSLPGVPRNVLEAPRRQEGSARYRTSAETYRPTKLAAVAARWPFCEMPINKRQPIFELYCNNKDLLVGAAGFEPTTCSTQNCRATRLRYTPIMLGSDVDTRLKGRQQGGGQPL